MKATTYLQLDEWTVRHLLSWVHNHYPYAVYSNYRRMMDFLDFHPHDVDYYMKEGWESLDRAAQ